MRIDDHERALRGDCEPEDALKPATGIVRALGLALLVWLLIALAMFSAGAGLEAEDFTDSGVGCVEDCLDPAEPMPMEP